MPHDERVPTDDPGQNPDPNQAAPPPSVPPPASGGSSREPKPIGVPNVVYDPDSGEYVPYTATVARTRPGTSDVLGGRGGLTNAPPTTTFEDRPPSYFQGDETRLFATRPRNEIINIQRGLVAAGMLDPEDMSPGVWDEATGSAMEDVLGYANTTGTGWERALDARIQGHTEAAELTESDAFATEPYAPPSWTELAEKARGFIERELDRELKPHEIEIAAIQLGKLHREEFETDIIEARVARSAQLQAAETGEEVVPQDVTGGVQDHALAYQAWMRETFGDEMDRLKNVEESKRQQEITARATSIVKNIL